MHPDIKHTYQPHSISTRDHSSISFCAGDFVVHDANDITLAYYLPPSCIKVPLTPTTKKTFCEWKGIATYYKVDSPDGASASVSSRAWSYDDPSASFAAIRGYLSFYAGPWECIVDGEMVEPQPGDFYGGWVTSDIEGIVKGRTGNLDPVV